MDRYFLRDIFIFLTYLAAVQWGMYIERSYGCTPTQNALDFSPRCYSLPIVEDLQSPKETEETEEAEEAEETEGAEEDDARKRWEHWLQHKRGPVHYVGIASPEPQVQYVKGPIVDGSRREADASAGEL